MAKKNQTTPRKNANYDFERSSDGPKHRIGRGDFAELPAEVIMRPYGGPTYRDGIVNSFTCSIENISGLEENDKGYD